MSVEFDTPAARVIKQFSGKDEEQFRVPTNLPDLTFLRALSVQGRLFQRQNTRTVASAANLITLTPATGETFFIYDLFLASTGSSVWTVTNKGVSKTFRTLGIAGQNIATYNTKYFDSIVGDGVSTFIVAIDATSGIRNATLLFWRENTSRIRDVTI